jgi:carbon-monoxide dehydrogenase medium subunit
VKPAAFAYAKARSLGHAVELLGNTPGARVLAGGQSLMAALNMRLDAPPLLVDVNGIEGFDRIDVDDGMVEIGALVRHAHALSSGKVAQHAPLIARALPHIAHPAIRNRGTIGGSIAYADPAAELPACLLALGGEVKIAGRGAERRVKGDDFFRGLFETALAADEIVTGIRVPAAAADMRYGFAELARRRGDYALVGLAACARTDGGGLRDTRLVYFGVGATPLRAREAEAVLDERGFEALDDAAAATARDLDPDDDIHASGKTRRHLAGVLLRRVAAQMQDPWA